ncbi:MAG TPA: hypothetical protein PK339_17130 [Flavitalea sp.]|nr:hypothetical protein [Flavitalea sp.]
MSLGATSSFAMASCLSSGGEAAPISDKHPLCLDYGRSFICNTGERNSVRMWIESRTIIYDLRSGSVNEYYQCGSCKSEDTFATKDLFYKDNYDFLPIFGKDKTLVFRRYASERERPYRTIKPLEEMWGKDPIIHLPEPASIRELDTWEKIRDAAASGVPIVTHTEINNEKLGLRAVIECPCKTLNINNARKLYQTDTGPVALPDLGKRYEEQMDCLRLAFIAFNVPEFADFVIEAPTPIMADGQKVAMVYHYSELLTLETNNKLYAVS